MKKISAVIMVILLSGLLFAGCHNADEGADAENPVAITIWHYYNGQQKEAFDRLVKEFNDTVGIEKGILVSAESKGEVQTLSEAVEAAAAKEVGAGEMPDIFATYVDSANVIYQMGLLTDISQYMTEEELAEYVPSFLEEGRLKENELQVLPVAKSTELLYLNKTDWDKFARETGHDVAELSTWEGLAEVAEDYYDWSGGKAFFGRDAAANYMYVGCHQLGTDVYRMENGAMTVQFADASLKKIWDTYAVPYIKGYFGAYGRFRSDDVKTGDMIACVASTASISYFPSEVTLSDGTTYSIEGMVLPLPKFEGTDGCSVQQGAGMAVARSDEQRETAAVEFLKWFTDKEQNVSFCVESGYFPVKTGDDMTGRMKEVLEEQGIEEDTLLYQNTVIGEDTIHDTELYTAPVIEDGEEYRKIITDSLTEQLNLYKESYQTVEQEEQEAFLEQCFEEWTRNLKQQIQK